MRNGQGLRSRLADLGTDQVIKGGRVGDTRAQVLQIPEIAQGLEDGSGRVRRGLASGGVNTHVLNVSLGRVR